MPAENTVEKLAWQRWAGPIHRIRHTVFIEEQKIDPKYEWDDHDVSAIHLGVLARPQDDKLIAYARLLREGKLTRMAVLPDYRHKGLGRELVLNSLRWSQELGLRSLSLDAQLSAIDFYEKLGFTAIGDRFWDAGIEHIKMTRGVEQP